MSVEKIYKDYIIDLKPSKRDNQWFVDFEIIKTIGQSTHVSGYLENETAYNTYDEALLSSFNHAKHLIDNSKVHF